MRVRNFNKRNPDRTGAQINSERHLIGKNKNRFFKQRRTVHVKHAAAVQRAINDPKAAAQRQAFINAHQPISRSADIQSEPLKGGFPPTAQAQAGWRPSESAPGGPNSGPGKTLCSDSSAPVSNPALVNHEPPHVLKAVSWPCREN